MAGALVTAFDSSFASCKQNLKVNEDKIFSHQRHYLQDLTLPHYLYTSTKLELEYTEYDYIVHTRLCSNSRERVSIYVAIHSLYCHYYLIV